MGKRASDILFFPFFAFSCVSSSVARPTNKTLHKKNCCAFILSKFLCRWIFNAKVSLYWSLAKSVCCFLALESGIPTQSFFVGKSEGKNKPPPKKKPQMFPRPFLDFYFPEPQAMDTTEEAREAPH